MCHAERKSKHAEHNRPNVCLSRPVSEVSAKEDRPEPPKREAPLLLVTFYLYTSNKCISTSNKCLTTSNKKLVETIISN